MKEVEAKRTQEKIEALGLPSPFLMQGEDFPKGTIGFVSDFMRPTSAKALTKYAVYASTSLDGGSADAMHRIGRKLGQISRENPEVREIEAPFLGCGKSGLTPDLALPPLAQGFLETRHPEAFLVLRNDDTLADRVAKQALDELFAPHIVMLVHGIRTHANWQEPIKERLGEYGLVAQPIKYGFFNVLMTILPGPQRYLPVRRVAREYIDLRKNFPDAKVSAIGHSFGAYALVKAIQSNPGIKLHRLILCGAVVSDSFRAASIQSQLDASPILNECGWKDIIPVMARGAGTGLGAAGRFGFGSAGIEDRFHNHHHSDFLSADFATKYWIPFLRGGAIERDGTLIERPSTSWFMSIISMRGFLTIGFLSLSIGIAWLLLKVFG